MRRRGVSCSENPNFRKGFSQALLKASGAKGIPQCVMGWACVSDWLLVRVPGVDHQSSGSGPRALGLQVVNFFHVVVGVASGKQPGKCVSAPVFWVLREE